MDKPPKKPATEVDRARAYRLRSYVRAGRPIATDDAVWLSEYEKRAQSAGNFGASRSKKRVLHMEEEDQQSIGTGGAAEAAATAVLVREEGRRVDYLVNAGVGALEKACLMYEKMTAQMLARLQQQEDTHDQMLEAVREQYLARTQAEIRALEAENAGDSDGITKMAETLLPKIFPNGGAKPA